MCCILILIRLLKLSALSYDFFPHKAAREICSIQHQLNAHSITVRAQFFSEFPVNGLLSNREHLKRGPAGMRSESASLMTPMIKWRGHL